VVDKLADMLFASDMILDMLHDERSTTFAGISRASSRRCGASTIRQRAHEAADRLTRRPSLERTRRFTLRSKKPLIVVANGYPQRPVG